MKCESCNSSYIKNGSNCYKIKENYIFYDPNNLDELLNCSSFSKYIIENTHECIQDPGDYYILNSNIGLIRKCHPNCLNCTSSPELDENENIISQNCTECISGYHFEFNTNNCYNDSILEQGYYYSQNDNMYHKCDIQCKTCKNYSTSEEPNCILCNNDLWYYTADNYPDTQCYNNESINLNIYFLGEIYENDNNENIITYKWFSCYSTCKSCSNKGDALYHDCDLCLSNYHFIDETKNCVTKEYAKNNSLYLSGEIFKQCDIACKRCEKGPEIDNTNCIECNTMEDYYNIEGDISNCFNYETLPNKGYYLDEEELLWKECYERCETCISKGNNKNMNCLSCKTDLINNKTKKIYYFELSNDRNCIEICPNNTLITPIGDCVINCPQNLYEYSDNKSCLENCPNNYEINETDNKCIFKGFDLTTKANEFKEQIRGHISSYVNSSNIINGSDFLAVVLSSDDMSPEKQLKKGISAIDLGNCTQDIKEYYNLSNNESFIILNLESKKEKSLKKNSSENVYNLDKNTEIEIYDFSGRKLNLSVCKNDIKIMKYIGDLEEELNIQTAKNLASQGIDVFNPQDDFFNDLCHKFDNTDGKDIILDDRRNDIYKNVSFCQDGCSYSGINYELLSADCLCDSSILQGDEKENNDDKKEEKQKEVLNFKSISKSFISNLLDFNADVLKCYNLVLYKKNLIGNIGFYSMSFLFLLQIVFFIIYQIKKLEPIKYFMLIFQNKNDIIKKNPPPKNTVTENNNKESTINNTNKLDELTNKSNEIKRFKKSKFNMNKKIKAADSISLNNNSNNKLYNSTIKNHFHENDTNSESNLNLSKFSKENKKSKKVIFGKNLGANINIQTSYINTNNKKNKIPTELKQSRLITEISNKTNKKIKTKKETKGIILKFNENEDKIHRIKNFKSKHKGILRHRRHINNNENNISRMNTIGEKYITRKKLKIQKDIEMNLTFNDTDLQDMDYEEAIIYDKRSLFRTYWAFLVDTQIILGTFCTENYLHLFIIKLSFFICTFQISFFLNALLYTDEYISDAYHNNGVLDFVSGLPKAIYSFVATLITTNLLKMLSNCRSELAKIIREKKKNDNYINLMNNKLSKLRKKLIAYFIIIFSLGLFFLYYVTCFCAVYKYSQKYWFMGCLESFGMDSLVALAICVVLSIFRFISIKKHIKCFYTLTNIIGTFL